MPLQFHLQLGEWRHREAEELAQGTQLVSEGDGIQTEAAGLSGMVNTALSCLSESESPKRHKDSFSHIHFEDRDT